MTEESATFEERAVKQERGRCPGCDRELVRQAVVPSPGEGIPPKGRYRCPDPECLEKGWFNRYGERR